MPLLKEKKRVLRLAWSDPDRNSCARCGDPITNDHRLFNCPANFANCWTGETGEGSDIRAEVEELYNEEKAKELKRIDRLGEIEKERKKEEARLASRKLAPPAPLAKSMSGANKTVPGAPSQMSSTSKSEPEKREKLPTEGVGGINRLKQDLQKVYEPPVPDDTAFPEKVDTVKNKIGAVQGVRTVDIVTNYLRVTEIPDSLYEHSLSFWQPVPKQQANSGKAGFTRRREIESAFNAAIKSESLKRFLEKPTWATDYKDLWSTTQLTDSECDFGPCEWEPPGKGKISNLYVTVKFLREMSGMREAFTTKSADDLADESRALNAIIARSIRLSGQSHNAITQVGANKFYLDHGYEYIGRKALQVQRGYFTSIRPSQSGPLLNVNVATSAFLPPILVSEFLRLNNGDHEYVEKLLKGCFVRITYIRQNYKGGPDMNAEQNRRKIFQQFGFRSEKQKFYAFLPSDKDDGNKGSGGEKGERKHKTKRETDPNDMGTTVFKYFSDLISKPDKPDKTYFCVNVGTKVEKPNRAVNPDDAGGLMRRQAKGGAIWVPANLLEICPNQPTKALLNARHGSEMIKMACRGPMKNAALIDLEGLKELGIKDEPQHLNDMGMNVQRNLMAFKAQNLGGVKLHGKMPIPITDASWHLNGRVFAVGQKFGQLRFLGLSGSLNEDQMGVLSRELAGRLKDHGAETTTLKPHFEILAGNESLLEKLNECLPKTAKKDCTVVVLRDGTEDEYATIKRSADLDYGRHVLCMLGGKVGGSLNAKIDNPQFSDLKLLQHLSNLSMKINMKVGGTNHTVTIHCPKLSQGKTIVIGADVTHPGPSQRLGFPSIACVVGSVDENYMRYLGSMRLQASRQEQIEDLGSMVKERLEAWKRQNENEIPDNIVFYRDGISESQFKACKDHEIKAVEEAYEQFCKESQVVKTLKLTFVVVGKRHNTRFYPRSLDHAVHPKPVKNNRNMNLKPGLYVPDIITDPNRTNFYLQSHNAIKGTARSAHYHVLEDGIGFEGLELPNLTHQLCYAFGRATKGVSYVAPAYIADRLCERGRVYLRNIELDDSFNSAGDQDLIAWKQTKALELARSEHWGNYNDDPRNGAVRLNPWHPDLDDSMFWM